jgi:hypothetical protein|tara:strand:+ start:3351 stop:3617 length:267 start_codon:yes stop_codon:yes gene_type:complete
MTDQQVKNPHQSEGQNYDIWNDGHHSRDAEVARLREAGHSIVEYLNNAYDIHRVHPGAAWECKELKCIERRKMISLLQAALKEEETNE